MAAAIPAPLKAADVARFAHRAGQLEKAKPVVAYYCELYLCIQLEDDTDPRKGYYWILDQVIAKGLHNYDDECKTYTTTLMDKLEQMKVDYAENNAITDDTAGHAYIEQFGQETFQRAEKTMNANKATRQTADTFQAAATFLDLGQIWGPLEPEIASKIKFAKYHALRIAKALKAGEDPNLSNPVPEPDPEDAAPLDPNDPEVQAINGSTNLHDTERQPSVEEIPDEHNQVQPYLAQTSTANESIHPSRTSSIPPQARQPPPLSSPDPNEAFYSNAGAPDVSPLGPSSTDRKMSSGGGYFPTVPDGVGHNPDVLPDPPPMDPGSPPVPTLSDHSKFPPQSSAAPPPAASKPLPPPQVDSAAHITTPLSFPPFSPNDPEPPQAPAPSAPTLPPTQPYQPAHTRPTPNTVHHPLPSSAANIATPAPTVASSQVYEANEEAIHKAQKHARWAISALNFEDVKTAVKELKGALESLGAS